MTRIVDESSNIATSRAVDNLSFVHTELMADTEHSKPQAMALALAWVTYHVTRAHSFLFVLLFTQVRHRIADDLTEILNDLCDHSGHMQHRDMHRSLTICPVGMYTRAKRPHM